MQKINEEDIKTNIASILSFYKIRFDDNDIDIFLKFREILSSKNLKNMCTRDDSGISRNYIKESFDMSEHLLIAYTFNKDQGDYILNAFIMIDKELPEVYEEVFDYRTTKSKLNNNQKNNNYILTKLFNINEEILNNNTVHLSLICTHPIYGKGMSKLIFIMESILNRQGITHIILEASNISARNVYLNYGYQAVKINNHRFLLEDISKPYSYFLDINQLEMTNVNEEHIISNIELEENIILEFIENYSDVFNNMKKGIKNFYNSKIKKCSELREDIDVLNNHIKLELRQLESPLLLTDSGYLMIKSNIGMEKKNNRKIFAKINVKTD